MKLLVQWALIAIVATMSIVVSGCAPEIVSVQPTSGTVSGGTLITLRGRRFPEFSTEAVQVWVGDAPCDAVTLLDQNKMECTTSAAIIPGVVDILLISSDGFRSTLTQSFEYTSGININPSSKTIGPGDNHTFEVTGGYKPYRYEVTAGEGSVEEVDTEHITYTASANTGSATILVTDAAGDTATISVTIQGAVTLALTPVSGSISADWDGSTYPFGEQIDLSATGGAPPYTFSNADAVAGRITGNQTYTVIGNANDTDTITVTDSKGNTDSIDIVTRETLSFTSSTATLAMAGGQTITFTITDSGAEPITIEAVGGEGTFDVTKTDSTTVRVWTPPATASGAPVAETIRITDVFGYTDEINITIFGDVAITADNGSSTAVEGTTASYTVSGGIDGSDYTFAAEDGNNAAGTVDADCGGTDVTTSVVQTSANQFNFTPPQGTAGTSCVIDIADIASSNGYGSDNEASIVLTINEPLTLRANRSAIVSSGNGPLNNILFTPAGGIPPYSLSEVVDTASATFTASTGTLTAGSANANGGEVTIRATDDVGNAADVKVLVLPRYEMTPSAAEVVIGGQVMVGTEGGFDDLFSLVAGEITYTSTAAVAQGNSVRIAYTDCDPCAGSESVSVSGFEITVDADFSNAPISTAQDIATAVNLHGGASVLVAATVTGDPLSNTGAAMAATPLEGGYTFGNDYTSNDDITYTSTFGGAQGNQISIEYEDNPALAATQGAVVTVSGLAITVGVDDDGAGSESTQQEVASAINTHSVASLMVTATVTGTGSDPAQTFGPEDLDTGAGASGTAVNSFVKDSGLGSLDTSNGIYTASNSPELAQISAVDAQGNTTEASAAITVLKPVDVAAGGAHSCARFVHNSTGRLKCWGENSRGQLGQGNTNDVGSTGLGEIRDLAFIDLDGADVLEVVAGFEHTCARVDDGSIQVKCWGSNEFGQLGLGLGTGAGGEHQGDEVGEMGASLPSVSLSGTPVSISAGKYHTCVTHDNGTAQCWGLGTDGQLGDGGGNTSASPVSVNRPNDSVTGTQLSYLKVAAGDFHTCGVLATGKVACWGKNDINQVGRRSRETLSGDDGHGNDRIEWKMLQAGDDAGDNICYVVEDNDSINTTGPVTLTLDSSDCALTIHIEIDKTSALQETIIDATNTAPIEIEVTSHPFSTGNSIIIQGVGGNTAANGRWTITDTGTDTFTLDGSDGTASGVFAASGDEFAWKGGGTNDTDMNDVVSEINSHPVTKLFLEATVTSGGSENMVITGVPPVAVDFDTTFPSFLDGATQHLNNPIADFNTVVLDPAADANGDAVFVTDDVGGSLGSDGADLKNAFDIDAGGDFTCVKYLGANGNNRLTCWGDGTNGRLGSGTTATRGAAGTLPTRSILSSADNGGEIEITTTASHLFADGDVVYVADHNQASANDEWTITVVDSDEFTLNGSTYVADGNNTGTVNRDIVKLGTAADGAFSVGAAHACAVTTASAPNLECWGDGSNGRLGSNAIADGPAPAAIADLDPDTVQVSTGWNHTCGVFDDGSVYCWGDNSSGQLGTGDGLNYGTAGNTMGALETLLPDGILF